MKRPPKYKKVYQFNLHGELINTYHCMKDAVESTGLERSAIGSNIIRKSLTCKKWYFSHNKDFQIPHKAKNHNPLINGKAVVRNIFVRDDIPRREENIIDGLNYCSVLEELEMVREVIFGIGNCGTGYIIDKYGLRSNVSKKNTYSNHIGI